MQHSFISNVPVKLRLAGYLLIITFTCSAQKEPATSPSFQTSFYSFSDTTTYGEIDRRLEAVIHTIDSIGNTPGIANHFCKTYGRSMRNAGLQMQDMDSAVQLFIKKFEIRFAAYFLDALAEYEKGTISSSSVWHCYFSSHTAQPWQFVLLGVNAHVNGDMWQTLVNEFSQDEIRLHQRDFISFQSAVAKNYDVFFNELMDQNSYARFMNVFTKGLAKFIGQQIINKWRRRQVSLANLFYEDTEKFKKKLAIVNRKKQKNNQKILRKK